MCDEEREVGNVSGGVYWSYARALGGVIVAFLLLYFFAAMATLDMAGN